ncbi:hypothetical protein KJ657_02415 [Patescibacteria group bacterium]|nr:hypothetical protein [Patescibacteria group bacterium]MBU1015920.1 hypothetical protein [Patescibacteria group bacterium]MBU1685089.1 hypothetical protein [Patescibacteria group bacterium]MBU1938148.1 hypothetical protein [Patescibacteria group bacterium]
MKLINKIIGFLLVFILTLNIGLPISYAETEPEKACKDKKPKYDELMKVWSETETKNQFAYEDAFEKAQIAHHDYVGCIFQFAINEILQSEGVEQSGTMAANTTNTGGIPVVSPLIDWMSPDQACLTPKELKNVIQKTEPGQLLDPILQTHADYRNYLQTLGDQFKGTGVITDEDGKPVNQLAAIKIKSANLETVKRQTKLEVDSSLMAIDLMFTSLKELRLSFVMHVHFQCTLKFLDKYRRALEDLRNVIEPLPGQLEDASVS